MNSQYIMIVFLARVNNIYLASNPEYSTSKFNCVQMYETSLTQRIPQIIIKVREVTGSEELEDLI